ncbi:MAG: DUF4013 domain-containing protein [Anaerolineales bacterium]|nr:DUF4013 domain-containing protein [Anaerolineales bacterium]
MELERAFTYIWKDPDWLKKLAIGGALAITGIGGIALMGWLAEMSRRVAHQEEESLPEWDQIGDFLLNGLKFIGVILVWTSPVIILSIIFSLIPAWMMFAIPEDGQGAAIAMISILVTCFWGFFMIYILAVNLIIPPLWVPVAEGVPFRELVNPQNSWSLFKANAGGFIVALLIGSLAGSLMSMAGVVLCVIGVFVTMVAAQLVLAHLIGQATAQAREAGTTVI